MSLVTGIGPEAMRKAIVCSAIENLTGSNFNDTLEGNAGNNVLREGSALTPSPMPMPRAVRTNGQGVTVNSWSDLGAEHDQGRNRHAERV